MENDDRKKYLKRLKIQNLIRIFFVILLSVINIVIIIYVVQSIIYENSEYYRKNNPCETQMSTQEIEAFNSQFTIYGGQQTGAKIKSLLGTIIATAHTYAEDYPEKVVIVEYHDNEGNTIISDNRLMEYERLKKDSESIINILDFFAKEKYETRLHRIDYELIKNDEAQSYTDNVGEMRNVAKTKSQYNVEFEYDTKGLIKIIRITE